MILSSHGIIGSQIVQFSGLLDTYTGAAAAYSLRQLRSGYTGSAIKVRRASDNTEQDIGFSNNELDTTSLASFCSGTNGFVTTWYDQSENGYNATQTTAANQPQIVSSGSVILENGKPSVSFNGSTWHLEGNSLSSVFSGSNSLMSTATVYKSTASLPSPQEHAVWGFGRSTTNAPTIFVGPSSSVGNTEGTLSIRSDSSVENRVYGASVLNQSLQQTQLSFNNSNIFINGVTGGTATATIGTVTLDRFAIGCLSRTTKVIFFNGKTQEIVIYNSDQSSNRTGIQTNINDFYSIY